MASSYAYHQIIMAIFWKLQALLFFLGFTETKFEVDTTSIILSCFKDVNNEILDTVNLQLTRPFNQNATWQNYYNFRQSSRSEKL